VIFEEQMKVRMDAINKKCYLCIFSNRWFEGFCKI